jgi:hypothetical protein
LKSLEEHNYAISAHPVLQDLSVVSATSRPCGGFDQS